jgi:hypothetical protein
MSRAPGRRAVTAIAFAGAACLPLESAAFLFSSETHNVSVDVTKTARRMARCDQFKLKGVQAGATAATRIYLFSGVCKIWTVHLKGGKEQGTSGEASLWAEAKATWNAQKNELEERVKLTDPSGKHSGGLDLGFKCLQDPIVQKSDCVRLEFSNGTDWTGFSAPADKNRPMLAGRTSLAEVDKLAKKVAASKPPLVTAAPVPELRRSPPPAAAAAAPASASASQRYAIPGTSLPDLASGAQVTVAGKHKVPWGGSLNISDADARAAANGVCQVAFGHTIRNLGPAASAASSRRWAVEGQPDVPTEQAPAIDGGGALSRVDTLPLRPGPNKLRLSLDNLEQVAEGNEKNNVYALVVNLSGFCGGAPSSAPRASGGPGNLRWSPVQGTGEAAAGTPSMPPTGRLRPPQTQTQTQPQTQAPTQR